MSDSAPTPEQHPLREVTAADVLTELRNDPETGTDLGISEFEIRWGRDFLRLAWSEGLDPDSNWSLPWQFQHEVWVPTVLMQGMLVAVLKRADGPVFAEVMRRLPAWFEERMGGVTDREVIATNSVQVVSHSIEADACRIHLKWNGHFCRNRSPSSAEATVPVAIVLWAFAGIIRKDHQ